MLQAAPDGSDGHSRHDEEYQRVRLKVTAQLREHGGDHLRLDRQHDDIGVLCRLHVVGCRPNAAIGFQLAPPLSERLTDHNLRR